MNSGFCRFQQFGAGKEKQETKKKDEELQRTNKALKQLNSVTS